MSFFGTAGTGTVPFFGTTWTAGHVRFTGTVGRAGSVVTKVSNVTIFSKIQNYDTFI